MSRWLSALALLLVHGSALAQSPRPESGLSLFWPAVEGCPTGAEVLDEIARLLGGQIPASPVLEATVTIPQRWVLDLVIVRDGARGERTLEGDSCGAVAHAAAVILAMAIDPTRVREELPPAAAPAGAGAPSPPVVVPPPPTFAAANVPPPAPRTSSPLGAGITAGPAYVFGVFSDPVLGLVAEAELRWRRWGVFLGGGYAAKAHIASRDPTLGGDHFRLLSGSITAGYTLVEGPIAAFPRAGFALSGLGARGSGTGLDVHARQISWWSLVLGQALLLTVYRPVALAAALDLLVPLARPALTIGRRSDPLVEPKEVGFRAFLGLSLRF